MSEERRQGEAEAKSAVLGRDVGDFLLELSIAVHRYAMYPAGHPSLEPGVRNLCARLDSLLRGRESVSIGVAQRQLVIDGIATSVKHPVLSDLAHRLHAHQLGALTLKRGAESDEVRGLLRTLGTEAEREALPIGLLPAEELPSWEHIQLSPLGYQRLGLDGDAAPSSESQAATVLWLGLAQAAMSQELHFDTEEAPDGQAVAEHIQSHGKEQAYDQVIVGYLLQLAQRLSQGDGSDREEVRRNVSSLISALDEQTLRRLLDMGGDLGQRRRFLRSTQTALSGDAVTKVLLAAADASGQVISVSLTRLLTKLSFHATSTPGNVGARAAAEVSDQMEALMSEWELADPTPAPYKRILDEISRASPLARADTKGESSALGLIQMALEVDAYGPMVETAVDDVIEGGALQTVFPMVEGAQATDTGRRIREKLSSPGQIEALLDRDDVDENALALMVQVISPERSVAPLLRVLADSESRAVRRKVFDRLVLIGPLATEKTQRFLDDPRWYVVRNILSLLHRVGRVPEDVQLEPFFSHPDVRVRREVFPLGFLDPNRRAKALVAAFRDADDRIRRLGVAESARGIPESVVPVLVDRLIRAPTADPSLAFLAVKALQSSRSGLARVALLEQVSGGKSWLGRPRLLPTSDLLLGALEILSRNWGSDPEVRRYVTIAQRSKDAAVRLAAGGPLG